MATIAWPEISNDNFIAHPSVRVLEIYYDHRGHAILVYCTLSCWGWQYRLHDNRQQRLGLSPAAATGYNLQNTSALRVWDSVCRHRFTCILPSNEHLTPSPMTQRRPSHHSPTHARTHVRTDVASIGCGQLLEEVSHNNLSGTTRLLRGLVTGPNQSNRREVWWMTVGRNGIIIQPESYTMSPPPHVHQP